VTIKSLDDRNIPVRTSHVTSSTVLTIVGEGMPNKKVR
jgi:hypothetical protein